MEIDDAPQRPNDVLAELLRQDLDRFSIAELEARGRGADRRDRAQPGED